jgi:hypothetical protein
MKMNVSNLFIRVFATTILTINFSSCSDTEFEGVGGADIGDTQFEEAAKKTDTHNKNDDENKNDNDYDVNKSSDLDERDDSAKGHDADFDSKGCKMPEDVKGQGLNSDDEVKNEFALGWGSSGTKTTEASLKGLDVKDCEWFEEHEKSGKTPLMLVYTDTDQSYAEPFSEGLNLGPSRRSFSSSPCQNAAALLQKDISSRGIVGTVVCSTVPAP